MYDVFIAHSNKDKRFAEKLFYALSDKFEPFLSSKSLLPGDRWNEAIPLAQECADATIVIISPHTPDAFYEQEEINFAIELSRRSDEFHRIVPLFIDWKETKLNIPYGLRNLHAIQWNSKQPINRLVLLIEKAITKRKPYRFHKQPLHHRELKELEIKRSVVQKNVNSIDRILLNVNCDQFVTLIYADIDGMKNINIKYGAIIGTEIIRVIEQLFNRHLNEREYYARVIGDQFLACVFRNEKKSVELAETIRREVESYQWDSLSRGLFVRLSIGINGRKIAVNKYDRIAFEDTPVWLCRTILGAKHAKRLGGNRVCYGPFELPNGIEGRGPEHYLSSFYDEYLER